MSSTDRKRALITGASKGVGRGIALGLAEAGGSIARASATTAVNAMCIVLAGANKRFEKRSHQIEINRGSTFYLFSCSCFCICYRRQPLVKPDIQPPGTSAAGTGWNEC